ncbi:hypothetical protein SALBM311S_05812 [Streptomyces alboniger]
MQQFPADPVDLKIVEVVSLAHGLNLAVTVEGVQTGAQAEQLRLLGCDTAQGGTTPARARRSACTSWRWWTRRGEAGRAYGVLGVGLAQVCGPLSGRGEHP